MSTMDLTKVLTFLLLLVLSLCGCGGGSSGTAIGPGGGEAKTFSGVVIGTDGTEVGFTVVKLLNTDEIVVADEAGAFELNSAEFQGGQAILEVTTPRGISTEIAVPASTNGQSTVELSIVIDQSSVTAALLDQTLRAKVVRNCSPFFLNTRTIRQTAPLPEDIVCTLEVQIKESGLPVSGAIFELEHRGCDVNAPWNFSGRASTGESGPGTGEIEFVFHNDQRHCVYRVRGPIAPGTVAVSTQIHTLRKQEFDD